MLVTHNRMPTVKKLILSVGMNGRFEVLMARAVKTIVFWDVCAVVDRYLQDGDGMFL
jgi:hypothetical protein